MEKKFEFKPFDKVLVRDNDGDVWSCSLYSNEFKDEYHCIGGFWAQCIPYEGNEHLIGTTDLYEPPYEPKDGDFVTFVAYVSKIKFTAICQNYKSCSMLYYVGTVGRERNEIHFNNAYSLDSRDVVRLATEEEKNQLLSKLHAQGKDWCEEKKKIVDWIWEPESGDHYYFPAYISTKCVFFPVMTMWNGDNYDKNRMKMNFITRTKEECQEKCERLNESIKKLK